MADEAAAGRPLNTRWWRPVALAVWIAAAVGLVVARGVPLDTLQVLAWVVATLALVTALGGGRVRRVFVDWLPLAGLLFVYGLTRGAADALGVPVHVASIAGIESALFGGEVPTVWLQEHLYRHPPWTAVWWEVPITVVYVSHFVVPYVVGAWHWTRGAARWLFWSRRYVGVTVTALAIFILVPAAPPWMAARLDVIGPVQRTAGRGWSLLGVDVAERLIDTGQASVNLVAAMPSLHAAHAALVPALFWRGRGRTTRIALLAYPAAMGFVLVVTGEHYVVDVLAGFALVAAVCWACSRWEARGGGDAVRPSRRTATRGSSGGVRSRGRRRPWRCGLRLVTSPRDQ
ncbi:phosphatase PAP2 family protein [Actinomadura sp. 7K507]|uniref:phosphatase PAP2 family protein n=1 Tax=Actinomadura sp. 7K507 TaxID=2530365 RepID=UPI00140479FD|nr:phosphatase PAP2 family protein [Actinomadura sp. 7K507]